MNAATAPELRLRYNHHERERGITIYQPLKISPSILSADFLCLGQEVADVLAAGADWVHFDVIDGHFAPNATIGVPVLHSLRQRFDCFVDVHLMVDNPLVQVPWFAACKPDSVTVHIEAAADDEALREIAHLLHDEGIAAGVALKPDTPVQAIEGTVDVWDMVLVMSVFPGFSGQSFIDSTPGRIAQLRSLCEAAGASPLVQVDGGIDEATVACVCAEGADVLVAGNAVFKHQDRRRAIESIRQTGEQARRAACEQG